LPTGACTTFQSQHKEPEKYATPTSRQQHENPKEAQEVLILCTPNAETACALTA
jgi:hypothetical protein